MGFDADRFVVSPSGDFFCEICQDVLEDPVQTPCEHCFCDPCIRSALDHHSSCPTCRQPLVPSQIKPLMQALQSLLNSMLVTCSNEGCDDPCELAKLQQHEAGCGHRVVTCPNGNCGQQIKFKDLDSHLESCSFRKVRCRLGCGLQVTASELPAHEDGCSFVPVRCTLNCGALIPQQIMEEHLNKECPLTNIACEVLGCTFEARRGDDEAWKTHHSTALPTHTELLCAGFNTHAIEMDRVQKLLEQRNTSVDSLSRLLRVQRMHVLQQTMSASNTVTWVVPDFVSHWTDPKGLLFSPELRFSNVPSPRHRYTIQIALSANLADSGLLGLSFVVCYAQKFHELEWPLQSVITLRCLNTRGGADVVKHLHTKEVPDLLRGPLCPGQKTNLLGWPEFLSQEEVEGGSFLHNNCLIVQCTLDGHLYF